MKHLILMRHAKAGEDTRDISRPLTQRGKTDATRMGPALAALGKEFTPDTVLCSSSRRTRETWNALRSAWPHEPDCEIREDLYLASAGELFTAIQECHATQCLLLIAHEPGLSTLVQRLLQNGNRDALRRAARGMPTATFAAFTLPIASWSELALGEGTLVEFLAPRDAATLSED